MIRSFKQSNDPETEGSFSSFLIHSIRKKISKEKSVLNISTPEGI